MPRARYHSRDLRRGRWSEAHRIYLVTIACRDRHPRFADPFSAATAARVFYREPVRRHACTLACVVMPDHVHWLLQLAAIGELSVAVQRYKASVSVALGERPWQRGFHDRALRREEDLAAAARYLVANPVRAGLVRSVRFYPYWNAVWL